MSRVAVEPLPLGKRELKDSAEAPWEARPLEGGLRAHLLWLALIIKVVCVQNVNWILSAGIHAALTLCIAGVALNHHNKHAGIGIEAGNFVGVGDEGFENVLGDDSISAGGGGQPLDTAMQAAELSQQSGDLAGLAEMAKMGIAAGGAGDGGDGGGSGGGSGGGHGKGIGLGAGFFGSKGAGKSFIYVVDCSGSMYGQRFKRAKDELVRSVNKLSAEQKFYVFFFFNDRTYPLFDPKPAKGMQLANKTTKQRASEWIRRRDPESTTNPNQALQQALEMKPEVIFLLTDGELDDPMEVREMIKRFNKSNVVIHTIAFENEEGAMTLEAIAKENNGTFRFVR